MPLVRRTSIASKKHAPKTSVKKSAKPQKKTTVSKRALKKTAAKKVAPKKKIATTSSKKSAKHNKSVKKPTTKKPVIQKKSATKKTLTPQKKSPTRGSIGSKQSSKQKTTGSRPMVGEPKSKLKNKPSVAPAVVKKSTKQSMNSKMKRTTSSSQQNRARQYKHTPIVFTIEDVHRVIEERHKNPEKATHPPHGVLVTTTRKTASGNKTILENASIAEKSEHKRVLGAASLEDILGFNPNAKKPTHASLEVDTSRIAKKHLPYLRSLMDLRKHLIEGMEMHAQDVLKKSTKDNTGDHSGYGQHMADVASDSFDRDFALGLLSNEKDALFEIEDAVERMRQGTYGICEITGETISEERLCAVPFTRFSLKGQQEYEKTHRRKSKHTGGIFAEMTPDEAGAYSDSGSND